MFRLQNTVSGTHPNMKLPNFISFNQDIVNQIISKLKRERNNFVLSWLRFVSLNWNQQIEGGVKCIDAEFTSKTFGSGTFTELEYLAWNSWITLIW